LIFMRKCLAKHGKSNDFFEKTSVETGENISIAILHYYYNVLIIARYWSCA
jgi:hypothetical protein